MPIILEQGLERSSQGILLITDIDTGKTIFEGHLRQCIHCQYTWTYRPGSGIRRGFCKRCNSFTCGASTCDTCYHKEKRIEDMEALFRMNRAAIEALVRQIELKERIGNAMKARVQDILRKQEKIEARDRANALSWK